MAHLIPSLLIGAALAQAPTPAPTPVTTAPATTNATPATLAPPSPAADKPAPSAPSGDDLANWRQLAAQNAWDDLYLATAAANPERYPTNARAEAAKLLLKGAAAAETDRVIALSLAETALRFEENDEALTLAATHALALGDQATASQHLERALARRPDDARLKLLRAHLARAQRDWTTAERLYSEITAQSPEHAEAQAALQSLATDRAADENRAAEGARRDLLRRRVEAEAMVAAMPVSEFDLCRTHTVAACEAIASCKQISANCSLLVDTCPASRLDSGMPRQRLNACAEALAKIDCATRQQALATLTGDTCRGLKLRSDKRLLPEGSDSADDQKDSLSGPGHNGGDLRRILQEAARGI